MFPEEIIVGVSWQPDLAHDAMVLIVLGKLSVGMGEVSIDIKAETHGVGLVPWSDSITEHMLVQGAILAGGDEGVGVTAPGNVRGQVAVLVEGGKGDKGSLDVPHIDSKVNAESTGAKIVSPGWPPSDPAHWTNCVDRILQTMMSITSLAHCVPDLRWSVISNGQLTEIQHPYLDCLVSTRCCQNIPQLRMPVTGEHMIVVSRPLSLVNVMTRYCVLIGQLLPASHTCQASWCPTAGPCHSQTQHRTRIH